MALRQLKRRCEELANAAVAWARAATPAAGRVFREQAVAVAATVKEVAIASPEHWAAGEAAALASRETPPFASDLDSRSLRLDVAREGVLRETTPSIPHADRDRVQRSVRAFWAADAQFAATWGVKYMAQFYADELTEAARAAARACRGCEPARR